MKFKQIGLLGVVFLLGGCSLGIVDRATNNTNVIQNSTEPMLKKEEPSFLGTWEVQFGDGKIGGMRRYEFWLNGTFTMTGYPEINDSGTFEIVKEEGETYTLKLTGKTGYSPDMVTIVVNGDTLTGLDNLGTYKRQ